MKVHPLPRKRNFKSNTTIPATNKKLRRLPHIFSRVLELQPFSSDAYVSVSETEDCFKFVADTYDMFRDVTINTEEVFPGVVKIIVEECGRIGESELDTWRFKLPESVRPELASAVCVDDQLVVTVPKNKDAVGWLFVVQ